MFRERFRRLWSRIRHYSRQHVVEVSIALLGLAFLIFLFAGNMFYVIPAGRVGVLWELFGGTQNRVLGEGFHVIMPWNKIFIYDTRVQIQDENLDVLSVDGLNLQIDVAFQFELNRAVVPLLHQFIGPDYINVMVAPDVAARARDVFSKNTPQQIYSDRRTDIQNEILNEVNANLHEAFNPGSTNKVDFVKVEGILVRSIKLPPAVESAIDSKNEQQQLNQEYDYRILREEKESLRKQIEAKGIHDFQQTVSSGITQSYLEWQGIQATLELAKSNNAKVVIIGSGRSGLPIILGDSALSPTATAALASPAPAAVAAAPSAPPVTGNEEAPIAPLAGLLKRLGLLPTPAPAPPAAAQAPAGAAAAPAPALAAPPQGSATVGAAKGAAP